MNEITTIKETMSSLDVCELTGMNHKEVLRAIRNMEPAWEKVHGRKFALISYTDSMNREKPCYDLSKTEWLYIATKFHDEARAKLVLRWEQLEKEKAQAYQVPQSFSQALLLAAQQAEKIEEQQKQLGFQQEEIKQLTSVVAQMEQKVSYLDKILACPSTVKVKTIAQDYGMSAIAFNNLLHKYGIQYKCGETWILYARYLPEGYVKDVPFEYQRKDGTTALASNMQWTQKGRMFLYHFLKEHEILPLIEANN